MAQPPLPFFPPFPHPFPRLFPFHFPLYYNKHMSSWTHNSKINMEEFNPSDPLWVHQYLLIRGVSPCPGPCP